MRKATLIALLLCAALPASAASVLAQLQLITQGELTGGTVGLSSQLDLGLRIEGGAKFGGSIGLSLNSAELQEPGTVEERLDQTLSFESAAVSVRDFLGTPMVLGYFTGEGPIFGSGTDFPERFGSDRFASGYSGVLVFGDGVNYRGFSRVDGTGVSLESGDAWDSADLSGFLYQDAQLGTGRFSADLRFRLNRPLLKLDAFAGASFPRGNFGSYRAGILLYYDTDQIGGFLTQIALTQWTPGTDALLLNEFFVLFEPRLFVGPFATIVTIFWRPEIYFQQPTGEEGNLDINARLQLGRPEVSPLRGGLDARLGIRPNDPAGQFSLVASPFFQLAGSGVVWDLRVNATVWPFEPSEIIQAFVGLTTEF